MADLVVCSLLTAIATSLRLHRTYLFQIHALHSRVHPPYHIRHTARDLAHRDGGLDARADGIDARRETQQVEFFVLLADGVLRVDFGYVGVVLLDGLPDAVSVDAGGSGGRESVPFSTCSFRQPHLCPLLLLGG